VVLYNITIAQLLTKPNFPTAITQIFQVISSNNNAFLLGLALLGGIGPVQIGHVTLVFGRIGLVSSN
jgi:hypothetical protein